MAAMYFNRIHPPTVYEVDVFVTRGRPFDVTDLLEWLLRSGELA